MQRRMRILGTDGSFVLFARAMQDRRCTGREIENDDLGLRPPLALAAFELFGPQCCEHPDCG